MRQIKFRAFIEPLNSMIQVSKLTLATSGDVMVWINDTFYFDGHEAHLMQYTGLKDKNGKEIYEGDILQRNNGSKYVVVFENGCFKLKPIGKHSEISTIAYAKHEPLKIIGNIYENPELLEENNV